MLNRFGRRFLTYVLSLLLVFQPVLVQAIGSVISGGAVVAGKRVTADIGGDLTIESRVDSERVNSDRQTISGGFGSTNSAGGFLDMGTVRLGLGKEKSSSDYSSVIEQSGILAGEDGFDIRVKGNTDLQGGIISSVADAEHNRLETGTITTGDMENHADASASSRGISISSGGNFWQGKYGTAKNVINNALDKGSAKDSSRGYTKSAIEAGTVVITDEAGQKVLTGQGTDETVASLNRDTENAHQVARPIDLAKLEQKAREDRELMTALLEEGFKHSDDAYKTMFIDEHPIFVIERDEKGKVLYKTNKEGKDVPVYRKLTDAEKQQLQADTDGKRNISMNGIFNDSQAAAKYAVQHADDKDAPLYFVWFPKTDSTLAELMVAGYQNSLESNFWGLTNSSQVLKDLAQRYGQEGLQLNGHSRGSMTIGNALNALEQDRAKGALGDTGINIFGPAFNAQRMADMLYRLSGGKQSEVGLENHDHDFVGSVIGGNPASNTQVPEGSNKFKEGVRIIRKNITTHGCYGSGRAGCEERYGPSKRIKIKAREAQ